MLIRDFDMIQGMKEHQVIGVSVSIIESSKISSKHSFGVMNSETNIAIDESSVFNACSISKFATAILALKLVSTGVLNLDLDVNAQLKNWKVQENDRTKENKVTLRNLLCHQSGLVDPEGSFGVYSEDYGSISMIDLLNGKTGYCSKQAEVEYQPYSDCMYSDLAYCLIELLITEITGVDFIELINREIFTPLGMKDSKIIDLPSGIDGASFTCGHDKAGNVIDKGRVIYPFPAAAGLWCTSRDLALLLIEVFDSLKGAGKLNISSQLMSEMIKPQGCKTWSGLGVFLDSIDSNLEITSFGWGVGYQCMIIGFPFAGDGAVIMTNSDTGMHQLKGLIGEFIKSCIS